MELCACVTKCPGGLGDGSTPPLLRGRGCSLGTGLRGLPELVLLRGAGGPGYCRAGWWVRAGGVDLGQARATVLEQSFLRATLVTNMASPVLSVLLCSCICALPCSLVCQLSTL